MNLIKKSCDLLIRQEASVSVRIYDAPELGGTMLLVTKENVFGFVADQELQARLIHSAREVLIKRKFEKKMKDLELFKEIQSFCNQSIDVA